MKRRVLFITLLISFAFSIFGCSKDTGEKYTIGQLGPAGGLVFFDKGQASNGWRYLEAAPVSTEFKATGWAAESNDMPETGLGVGSGKSNTDILVKLLEGRRETDKAAQLCAGLNFGGFSDWFLPSDGELKLMYENLHQKGLGDFDDIYWSSSRAGARGTANVSVWHMHFSNGLIHNYPMPETATSARAVRAF
ncbi:MAG: DUF1566 domain-containing protein [Leptospirales bacterium]|nr:DUF1566 domain-containing protein [Leptospirales bacterium]